MCNLMLTLLLLVLGLLALEVSAQPFHTLVTSLHKDPNTSLHTITLTLNPPEQYLVDLDAPFIWDRCDSQQETVSCDQPECLTARSYISRQCPEKNNTNGQCTCYDTPVNPITGSCASSYLSLNLLGVYWTAGRHLSTYRLEFDNRYISCAPSSLLKSLPANAIGVASFSWSTLSVLYQFTPYYIGVTQKFSLCLSNSSDDKGVIFFGDGPYYLEPPANFDVSSVLSYIPLINSSANLGYFINLTAISIDQQAISVPADAYSLVNGGVKFSTTVPYTTLRRDIYSVFIGEFRKAMKGVLLGKKVSPFDFCFKTQVTQQKKDVRIPRIDLALGNGGNWTVYESNLLKQVDNNASCLAFVDGGNRAEHAVVIGTYQMEDIMLQFDQVESRLGYSPPLSSLGSSCGNFDFAVWG